MLILICIWVYHAVNQEILIMHVYVLKKPFKLKIIKGNLLFKRDSFNIFLRNFLIYLNYCIAVIEKGNDKMKGKELFEKFE